MSDKLGLKWGTAKFWELETTPAREAMKRYLEIENSYSAMAADMNIEAKSRLCAVIDALGDGCEIVNDWSGDKYTKEEAKEYVMEYRS